MSDQMVYRLSDRDVAVRLNLISKVHGFKKAEEFFNSISQSARSHMIYSALLRCFVDARQLEKAEDLMQKIGDMEPLKTECYNLMLNFYSHMGKYEKLDVLMQEMEEKGIVRNSCVFNIRLQAYVACSDIEGMEKFLMRMEADPQIKTNCGSYIIAANGYLKADFKDKYLIILKRLEELFGPDSEQFPYDAILTLYTAIGNKAEVYRIWYLSKQMGRNHNNGYLCMISSLVKLDDLDGAEKVYEEWYSGKNIVFDSRIPNVMISAYSRKGLLDKAEACINKIVESGNKPHAMSWVHLASGYRLSNEMTKAEESIKKAISISKVRLKPHIRTLASCLKHLKDQGDIEAAKDLIEMVCKHCHFSVASFNRLLSCINDENIRDSKPGMKPGQNTVIREYVKSQGDNETVEGHSKLINKLRHFSRTVAYRFSSFFK